MRYRAYISLFVLVLGMSAGAYRASAQAEKTRILFLVDASLSMRNNWMGGIKWSVAVRTIDEIADSLNYIPGIEIGLRVFGHLSPEPDKNCHDTRLEVPIEAHTAQRIRNRLDNITPKGITPLAYSIEKSADDFSTASGKNIVIIVTDGEDACDGDVCAASAVLQSKNITLKPFIIGMSLQPHATESLDCAGRLINTGSADEFSTTVKKVVLESLSKTTLQVNLNDLSGKPTETNVNMTFYDLESGQARYNFYHSLNAYGQPDTLVLSPMNKYRLQIHTVPPIVVDTVALQKNTHNVVSVKAPQGYLNFTLQGYAPKSFVDDRIKCLVHKQGQQPTIYVQDINTKEKYLVGTYDLEVLTLPRMKVLNVKIDQSKTTDVKIPAPGILTINKVSEVYGGIFMIENGRMKKIYDLTLKDMQETLALQPGKYHLVYRSKNARTIHTSVDKEFDIAMGGALSLKL